LAFGYEHGMGVSKDYESASKYFKFGQRKRLSVFAEFYNLFNRANFCDSEEDVNAST
jgi:hypothetical protein